MTVGRQCCEFAVMAACGGVLGAAYDLLLAAGRLPGAGRIVRGLLDLGFGLLCAAAMIAAALCLHTPVMRGYVIAAAVLGFAVYMQTIGRIVRYSAAKIRRIVRKS